MEDRLVPMSEAMNRVRELFEASIEVKRSLLDGERLEVLPAMAERISTSIAAGGKLTLCGRTAVADVDVLLHEIQQFRRIRQPK